jgi:hypothetical protein
VKEQKVQEIHPFDLGGLLRDNETGAEVTIRPDGLIAFDGKIYKQSAAVGYSPQNDPKVVAAHCKLNLAQFELQDAIELATLRSLKAVKK